MTREEQIKQAAMDEPRVALGSYQRAFTLGAQWADKTMLEKACKWLNEYCRYGCCEYIEKNEFINDFKKAMEQ